MALPQELEHSTSADALANLNVRFWDPVSRQEPQFTPQEIKLYSNLLVLTKGAKAYPRQSGFFVRSSVYTTDGHFELGGNDEYAFSDAFIHGETSALAASLAKHDGGAKVLFFYGLCLSFEGRLKGGSCGNCRDVFNEYVDPEMLVIEGDETKASVTHWKDYVFEDFTRISSYEDQRGVREAQRGIKIGVDVYLPKHLKEAVYGVSIVSVKGTVWMGSLDTNAGYDAITPGVAARQVWRNTHPEAELDRIIVAQYGAIPHPLYRDRQMLTELDESLMYKTGRKDPLPVYLLNLDTNGNVIEAAQTDSVQWLPIPFTPGSFGMTEAIKGSLKGLF